ncbi:MAG: hypothetical protein J7L23_03880, partial [Candidatus Diapherotrites archaeon]|nr:hypothetical protein [Candidatus Diapherotrites archaeon]
MRSRFLVISILVLLSFVLIASVASARVCEGYHSSDCDDGNPCTIDVCSSGHCTHELTNGAECYADSQCGQEVCNLNTCTCGDTPTECTTLEFTPDYGEDTTDNPNTYILTSSDLQKVSTSDDTWYKTRNYWISSYYSNRYMLFDFSPNIPSDNTVHDVTLYMEWKTGCYNVHYARVLVWDESANEWVTHNLPTPSKTDRLDVIDLRSYITSPDDLNNVKIKFQAHDGYTGGHTYYDLVKITAVVCEPQPVCGNGIIEEGEECEADADCDDGNSNTVDSCRECTCEHKEIACDARSVGYWSNNEGCPDSSYWADEISELSNNYFHGAFHDISGEEICETTDISNCPSANQLEGKLCRAKAQALAVESNLVSGRLTLGASLAGSDNGDEAFDNLGLGPSSTIEDAMLAVEEIILNGSHTSGELTDAATVAERIISFYEDENPQYPECIYTSCGDGYVGQDEECELPDTDNNTYCDQSTEQCAPGTNKTQYRDAYGYCDGSCGCVDD